LLLLHPFPILALNRCLKNALSSEVQFQWVYPQKEGCESDEVWAKSIE
jgi:hypothetical protein